MSSTWCPTMFRCGCLKSNGKTVTVLSHVAELFTDRRPMSSTWYATMFCCGSLKSTVKTVTVLSHVVELCTDQRSVSPTWHPTMFRCGGLKSSGKTVTALLQVAPKLHASITRSVIALERRQRGFSILVSYRCIPGSIKNCSPSFPRSPRRVDVSSRNCRQLWSYVGGTRVKLSEDRIHRRPGRRGSKQYLVWRRCSETYDSTRISFRKKVK